MQSSQGDQTVQQYKESLFAGAKNNDGALIQSFLQNEGLQLDLVLNHEKQNVLHVACIGGAEDVLDMMLAYSKVVDKLEAKDCQRRTPMHYAAAMGFSPIASKLLSARAEIDLQDEKGATPLHLAVRFEWSRTIQVLLEAGANPMVEDSKGYNCVDVALSKGGAVAELLSGFEGQRRQTTLLQSLRQLVFPQKKLRLVPSLSCERSEEWKEDGTVAPLVAPVFFEDVCGEHVEPPMELGSEQEAGSSRGESSGIQGSPASALQSSKGRSPKAMGLCRVHVFFDEDAKRLEFEVEWQHGCPAVGVVKPGGQAERRGLVQGDLIVAIAGTKTAGKGRDELLPLMKQRPLMLTLDREAEVFSEPNLHCQLTLSNPGTAFDDQGLEVAWCGSVPTVAKVRPNSNGWAAGVLEGDAIVCINGKESAMATRSVFNLVLDEQLKTIVVRRAPIRSSAAASE